MGFGGFRGFTRRLYGLTQKGLEFKVQGLGFVWPPLRQSIQIRQEI